MKYIAVFCSASELEDKYTKPAREFAKLLVKNNYHLVWGASDKGLMREIAAVVHKGGRRLIGVTIPHFKDFARKGAHEMIITKTLGERKATMLLRSDAIAVLVGGIGTLDEITEIVELKKQKKHDKPIVILNTENFYEGFKVQMQKMRDDGFIEQPLDELLFFADKPQQAIDYISEELKK